MPNWKYNKSCLYNFFLVSDKHQRSNCQATYFLIYNNRYTISNSAQPYNATMSPYYTQFVVLMCSQLFFAGAFAAFIPDADDVMDGVDYDISKPNIQPIDDEKMYRALSHVLASYLNSQRDSLNDFLAERAQGHYYPTAKQEPLSGFKPIVDKRKVFWQPLGYLPPGSRKVYTDSNSGSSSNSGGQVFRYG